MKMIDIILNLFKKHTQSTKKNMIAVLEALGLPRSYSWNKLRKEILKKNPKCAVCGSKKNLVPHHIIPFHKDPSKELDEKNIIVLCQNKSFNCHFFFGHLKNWKKYNDNIIEDAKIWNEKLNN